MWYPIRPRLKPVVCSPLPLRGGEQRDIPKTSGYPKGRRAKPFTEAVVITLVMWSSLGSIFLSARQHQLSDFNFIHRAAITPSGSCGMNTNRSLDCFKCRSEPDTCFHFVRSCRFIQICGVFPLMDSVLDTGVCVFVRGVQIAGKQRHRKTSPLN